MLTFPNAKLNLGLYVTARRPDGYHTLESAFVPLPWCDALELVPAPANQSSSLALTGRPIPGDPATNLCLRAYELLKADFPALPPVQLHLHKIVPIGAGLGGGSADAAFALKLVNSEFDLGLSEDALESYARRLGADCAFFIRNQPVLAVEKGDVFEPLDLNLKGTACAVIYPGLHISTAEAYGRITPRPPQHELRAALAQPMATWRDTVSNDFEEALTPHYPVLGEIKQLLYAAGATYASLSGSGSAVYGLFSGHETVPSLSAKDDYLLWTGLL
ncbi:4-(cytidine 5'-diphospho)-2-C-methyl-D-erythritol kinase [Hymenobacter sp. ASUV-10]|uniref:4-diphosphocytidyl-2-C-methyl-D-erythritol kinase n=1 Tax=Hymenobacter aranciens TaxID=3063996 RepID=A0ABT9B8L9_9BACT|nr:4-(cytidine 5'-diphospho)-2-C-methyl-D-erythritol kinase [Hymenobacter sp. ASUV-10]MDO7874059.1 4-(cytidine 5'-diphospho)-2-C-methyl-D-erythritol kinase [Hymenobacter sp. ASUV-10]